MEVFNLKNKNNITVLALGPESDGNFSILKNDKLFYVSGFGDLLNTKNWLKYKSELYEFLEKEGVNPEIVVIDLHPLFKTSQLGKELALKFNAKLVAVQHHYAHVFSSVFDKMINDSGFKINKFIAIASDGTGYNEDGTIWGGEVLKWTRGNEEWKIKRIGSLEEQIMIGGDLAIKEPARMLLSVLLKIKSRKILDFLQKFYKENDLDILIKQYNQKFNCQQTTSTGRILDAVSVLLSFSENKREYKHQPIDLLVKESSVSYDIEAKIEFDKDLNRYIVSTSCLFEYLLNNLNKDNRRLAATAQLYLAKGFYEIAKEQREKISLFSGGMANSKIMSKFLQSNGVYINKKIPCGDKGISVGQIVYVLTNSGN